MKSPSTFLLCALVYMCCNANHVYAKDYITETKTYTPECTVSVGDLESNVVQYKSSLSWAKGHAIGNWKMKPWESITDPSDTRLVNKGIVMLKGTTIRYNKIEYNTGVSLNPILKKLINTELPIFIQKELFVVNNKMTVYVKIKNVPLVSYVYITNVIDVNNPKSIVSSHFVSHGPIPWYAKWSIGILKHEILTSVDDFDEIVFKNVCNNKKSV